MITIGIHKDLRRECGLCRVFLRNGRSVMRNGQGTAVFFRATDLRSRLLDQCQFAQVPPLDDPVSAALPGWNSPSV
jgi:hypothetical protein